VTYDLPRCNDSLELENHTHQQNSYSDDVTWQQHSCSQPGMSEC